MPDGGDTRALVHVEADVTLVRQPRLARVQPHAHANRPAGKCALAVRSSGDRVRRAGECDEKRITLRVDLDALVLGKRRAESPPMLVQRLPVVVAELMQQPRRALHIREQQRHDTGRETAHHRTRSCADARSLSSGQTVAASVSTPRSAALIDNTGGRGFESRRSRLAIPHGARAMALGNVARSGAGRPNAGRTWLTSASPASRARSERVRALTSCRTLPVGERTVARDPVGDKMAWAWRSPDVDVRCDESRKRERTEQGRGYSCVLQIPDHGRRGH